MSFRPGDTPIGDLTAAICHDLDFPELIRQASGLRASTLIGPSDDWSDIDWLHADMARMRSVESGVTLLRPAWGVSLVSDPEGRVIASRNTYRSGGSGSGVLVAEVPMIGRWTAYGILGQRFSWLCLVSLLALLAAGDPICPASRTLPRGGAWAGRRPSSGVDVPGRRPPSRWWAVIFQIGGELPGWTQERPGRAPIAAPVMMDFAAKLCALAAPLATSACGFQAAPLPFAWPPQAGQPYPELALLGLDGETVHLSDYRGKVLLIEPIGMT